jgi:hypothetical protein
MDGTFHTEQSRVIISEMYICMINIVLFFTSFFLAFLSRSLESFSLLESYFSLADEDKPTLKKKEAEKTDPHSAFRMLMAEEKHDFFLCCIWLLRNSCVDAIHYFIIMNRKYYAKLLKLLSHSLDLFGYNKFASHMKYLEMMEKERELKRKMEENQRKRKKIMVY